LVLLGGISSFSFAATVTPSSSWVSIAYFRFPRTELSRCNDTAAFNWRRRHGRGLIRWWRSVIARVCDKPIPVPISLSRAYTHSLAASVRSEKFRVPTEFAVLAVFLLLMAWLTLPARVRLGSRVKLLGDGTGSCEFYAPLTCRQTRQIDITEKTRVHQEEKMRSFRGDNALITVVCLSVWLSVCPVPDPKSRTERRGTLKIDRKVTRDPI